MEVLAIIPARGGSKGIPRKNLVDLRGRPLLAYSIAQALEARSIHRVVVSTEDEEIAEVARRYGADIPFMRPRALAEDHVLDLPVFEHVLEELAETEGYRPDLIAHLRPTAPIRQAGWLDEAIQLLVDHPDADSVRSVSAPSMHPYRMFRIGEDGYLDPIMDHEHEQPYLLRRQDLPAVYYYNCVIDVTRRTTITERKSMTGAKILPYVMDPDTVFDIDSPRDLDIVRLLAGRYL